MRALPLDRSVRIADLGAPRHDWSPSPAGMASLPTRWSSATPSDGEPFAQVPDPPVPGAEPRPGNVRRRTPGCPEPTPHLSPRCDEDPFRNAGAPLGRRAALGMRGDSGRIQHALAPGPSSAGTRQDGAPQARTVSDRHQYNPEGQDRCFGRVGGRAPIGNASAGPCSRGPASLPGGGPRALARGRAAVTRLEPMASLTEAVWH